ncbi:MAG: cobyrinate a,c-diamide synthase [Streptosporangiaceae bacterium]
MVAVPRLVIAAPASGSGKTTVACGLMAALRAAGLAVSGHKAGPDYIDPGYHVLATGRPARNLDPFLCGEDRIVPLFRHGARGADVAVVEGVMGLFDGAGDQSRGAGAADPGFGSTAHVARLLGAPIVLVIDAAAMGRSAGAVAAGFAGFDPRTTVAGVILNRVASDRHERLLRDGLAAAGLPVFGALRRSDQVAAPSRHLGLIPAAERSRAATDAVARLAALVRDSCDLGALLALARSAPPLPGRSWDPAEALAEAPGPVPTGVRGAPAAAGPAFTGPAFTGPAFTGPAFTGPAFTSPDVAGHGPGRPARPDGPVVAMAGGTAFTFSYTEHAELLAAAGLEVVVFDPLRDERLPPGPAGVILGGGFPEVHAAELSANEPLRRDVADAAACGVPVAAECAGLLYLARSLDGHPMCGVLPAEAAMTGRLTLGYREARAEAASVLAAAGDVVRAHEFHRTAASPAHGHAAAWRLPPAGRREGHISGMVHASYLHAHWAGYPHFAARFAAACRAAAPEGALS